MHFEYVGDWLHEQSYYNCILFTACICYSIANENKASLWLINWSKERNGNKTIYELVVWFGLLACVKGRVKMRDILIKTPTNGYEYANGGKGKGKQRGMSHGTFSVQSQSKNSPKTNWAYCASCHPVNNSCTANATLLLSSI